MADELIQAGEHGDPRIQGILSKVDECLLEENLPASHLIGEVGPTQAGLLHGGDEGRPEGLELRRRLAILVAG